MTTVLPVLAGLIGLPQPTSATDGEFVNLSNRGLVGTGDDVRIVGFIIEGGSRQVLIQALGPELANRGVSNPLDDPVLTVIQESQGEPPRTPLDSPIEIMVNDNWEDSQGQLVSDLWGGSPPLAAGSLSAAVVLNLEPGGYTAKVEGKNGTTGVAIVEVFRITPDTQPSFAVGSGPGNQSFTVNTAISALTLPEASGGNGALTYSLTPAIPGLNFNPTTRRLTGTPTSAGTHSMTYTVTDADGDSDSLTFNITVEDLDRELLTAFFNATDGPNWSNSDNWLTDAPLDQWHGVTVDGNGRVIALNFYENQLSGPIPAELGKLNNLQELYLNYNLLSGPIPVELGNLTNLLILHLVGNQLSGPIPVELGNINYLQDLSLGDNLLSGPIPVELGKLNNLQELWLNSNLLSGPIPVELGNINYLQELWLGSNLLSGPIPVELGNINNLQKLSLGNNQLSGPIPAELGNINYLTTLALRYNQLSGAIPAELGNIINLQGLWLDNNQLSGPIPVELDNLINLTSLDLRNNQLNGPIPPELGNLINLQGLWLDNNQLSGPIPVELGNLINLQGLWLHANLLSGPIPAELGNINNLHTLWLHDNQLSGPIPVELGNLINLQTLLLFRNQLSGPIPAELGNLSNLQKLWLSDNLLSGCIPDGLRDVADNDLSALGLLYCGDAGQETTHEVGDTISDLPTGSWTPDVNSGGVMSSSSGGNVTLRFNDGEYIEEGGFRYTCQSSGGCTIENRLVSLGTIAQTPEGTTPGGSASVAPADEQAFNRLVVGNRLHLGGSTDYIDFPSAGRFILSGSLEGSYSYANTGSNTGTLTQTYDSGNLCTILLTFDSVTTGTQSFTCTSTDIQRNNSWTITADDVPPAPVVLRDSVTDTSIEFGFSPSFDARETKAFDFQMRRKTPQEPWSNSCNTFTNNSANAERRVVIFGAPGLQPGTVYEARYRSRNASSCDSGSPGPWSLIGEGRTTGGTGPDTQPSFAVGSGPGNQSFTVNTAISTLTLPEASGGNGALTYSLTPSVPGLSFNPATRRLTGTPTSEGTHSMTYTVTDADGDSDSLAFTVMVEADNTQVSIPDANLRATIEDALGKASGTPITVAEMKTLTRLEANDSGISDLTGLEFATSLSYLNLASWSGDDLPDNNISDISLLSGMTNLETLWLGGNKITDISALASLINLERLSLQSNSISDISPLAGLTKLWYLKLGYNNRTIFDRNLIATPENSGITDISPLAGLTKLISLELQYNNIQDISALSGMTNLNHLILQVNPIEDISALSGLTKLTNLLCGANRLTNISALSDLVNLRWLSLEANNIVDLSPLAGLTNLESLDLNRNNISDLSPLSGLIALKGLTLWRNDEISDVSALSDLTNLTRLDLAYNRVEDISALSGLTNLTRLDLWLNKVTDISPILGLINLTELELRWNPLNDLSFTNHIPTLENRGVTVFFTNLRKGDFDIELVFTDTFSEDEKDLLRLVTKRWMAVIKEDLPDYEFTEGWSGTCGDLSYEIPAGERVDDLRIYMTTFDGDDLANRAVGWGGPMVLRDGTSLPVLGCMGFDLERANLLITGLHEIGHVLGFGTIWEDLDYLKDFSLDDPNADTHFSGQLAITAFDDAGGTDYTGNKVPVQQMDGAHWRHSVLEGELMGPSGGGSLSAITVQSLADLGYGVDVSQADEYALPHALSEQAVVTAKTASLSISGYTALSEGMEGAGPVVDPSFDLRYSSRIRDLTLSAPAPHGHWCGLGLESVPIDVVDAQGRIIRVIDD